MLRSVLIANRGEIAVRIIRTARRMGLRTIAVYSEADRQAMHVALADVAVPIGPAAARDSYLRADRIIAAALATGAEAIHPGYGFLSEKVDLPQLCQQNGIVWVGPHLDAIAAMGSKIEARRLAASANVPVVPGYNGEDQKDDQLVAEALRVGLPVMIKATAGGGGKGMRPVSAADALPASIAAARREAEAAFGDGRLLIEKLIARPRHIEVQVLGDKRGHLVHLFERDCSVQRNNQKLLEEAPAPNLSTTTRAALHRHAVQLAAAIGYDSAGTMEFMVDAATEDIFFLEMNTRLQVEHTVTEEVTGLDLVEWQLRVAAGEPLAFTQDDIRCEGHAIQARITAERADQGFRPDIGKIELWSQPSGIRIDTGVSTGTTVGLHYDSLLAKMIATGSDRAHALEGMRRGLEDLTVLGPATNRAFLLDAIGTPDFIEGRATTQLIADNWPVGWSRDRATLVLAHRLAAIAAWVGKLPPAAKPSPWSSLAGFRTLDKSGRAAATHVAVTCDGVTTQMKVAGGPRQFVTTDTAGSLTVDAIVDNNVMTAVFDGALHRCSFAIDGRRVAIRVGTVEATLEVCPMAEAALETAAGTSRADASSVVAPMPGLVADIMVTAGDEVIAGQTVAVLESMKLFTDLKVTSAGRVTRVLAARGESVAANVLIMTIEPAEAPKPQEENDARIVV
ncbi:biotin carboxylase N-terminal domain-containing protein [Bradyrhizobium genosp. P]|uniref:acetyl/propionyl/methylcrotonyl-CoA carboxylase subunit alpha n=1 Tax=Bradyrhizobium genosp. P TaxID=83641 RepID=UPI003CEADDE2